MVPPSPHSPYHHPMTKVVPSHTLFIDIFADVRLNPEHLTSDISQALFYTQPRQIFFKY